MHEIGIIKIIFSSVLNRLEITSMFINFRTIYFSKKKLLYYLYMKDEMVLFQG